MDIIKRFLLGLILSISISYKDDSIAFGWQISNYTTINGNVSYDTFTISNNQSNTVANGGWVISTTSGTSIINGSVHHNTFELSNLADNGHGWSIHSSAVIKDIVSNINFHMNNNLNSIGIHINMDAGETIVFDKAIANNRFTINGSTTGDYGFQFNTNSGNGSINFNGNSSASQLSSSNNNASVTPTVPTAGIDYSG